MAGEEIEAITKALEIFTSRVAPVGNEHGDDSVAAGTTPLAFLQVRSLRRRISSVERETSITNSIVMDLRREASRIHSSNLSLVATKMASATGANPLKRVTEMIRDMISRLTQEATSEAEANGSCQARLGENKVDREAKTHSLDELKTESEQLSADIQELNSEVSDLNSAISTLDAERMDAEQKRKEQKADNDAAIKDSQGAQVAIKEALAVLSAFYDKAKTQGREAEKAQASEQSTFSDDHVVEVYSGSQDGASPVVQAIEVVLRDYERFEEATTRDEQDASDAHTKYMNESEINLEVMKTQSQQKQELHDDKAEQLASVQKEATNTQSTLDSLNEVFEALKEECVATGLSYEERKKLREQEITALENAKEALLKAKDEQS